MALLVILHTQCCRPSMKVVVLAETWTAKHAPKLQQDLVVHSKKVAEVEAWLAAAADLHGPPCAIISGKIFYSCSRSACFMLLLLTC